LVNVYLQKIKERKLMENAKQESVEKGEEKKKGFWAKFYNFLAYGGIMIIVVGGLGIFILISILMK
jgi:hypothetical protein